MTTVSKTTEKLRPWVRKCFLELARPRLGDNLADVDRLVRALSRIFPSRRVSIPYRLWNDVPRMLRDADFAVTAALTLSAASAEVVALEPGNTENELCGLAVDLGTTTLEFNLLDLVTGEVLAQSSVANPQALHGADVLTRIQFAAQPGGLETLQRLVIDCFNRAVGLMCGEAGVDRRSVLGAAVAGNTTMTHLFLGLDPYYIRREPYIPVINRPGFVPARDLSLDLGPGAEVFVFPSVGSYFGGDLVAGILSSGMYLSRDVCLLVDIGTNAEVVLGNRDWLLACAGAAGPALEGGVARMGMQAGFGVIDHVAIAPGDLAVRYSTIGQGKPLGMCGSALIDLTAELFERGIIDMQGKFRPERGARLLETDDGPAFVVAEVHETAHGQPITLSQVDLDVLLRSKAAMYTILQTIVAEVGIDFTDVSRFYVAGTFGSYIDPRKAVVLGMVPDLPPPAFVPLGNSSVAGAREVLLNRSLLEDVGVIAGKLTYMELNVNQLFMNLFSAARFIPHTERSLFPSVATDAEKAAADSGGDAPRDMT